MQETKSKQKKRNISDMSATKKKSSEFFLFNLNEESEGNKYF